MEIIVPGIIYALSCIYTSVLCILFIRSLFKNHIFRYLKLKSIKSGKTKSVLVLLFILNMNLFLIYFYFGFLVSFYKGFVAYRSMNTSTHEKMLQVMEVSFECLQKTLMFLSLSLFLPILKSISSSFISNLSTKKELKTIVLYTIMRLGLYLTLYLGLFQAPILGLYLIEIFSLAESLSMVYIYVYVHTIVRGIIKNQGNVCDYESRILTLQYKRFHKMTIVYVVQLIVEIVYKTIIIIFSLVGKVPVNGLLVGVVFLLKLLCFGLQFYALDILLKQNDATFPTDIFWTPAYNEDFMFFTPQELNEMSKDDLDLYKINEPPSTFVRVLVDNSNEPRRDFVRF